MGSTVPFWISLSGYFSDRYGMDQVVGLILSSSVCIVCTLGVLLGKLSDKQTHGP